MDFLSFGDFLGISKIPGKRKIRKFSQIPIFTQPNLASSNDKWAHHLNALRSMTCGAIFYFSFLSFFSFLPFSFLLP